MFLILNKFDKSVVYSFTEKPIIGKFLKHPIIAYDIRNDTHEVIETKYLPADFTPGAYEYDGAWKVKYQQLIDAQAAQKIKQPDPKQEAISELAGLKKDQEGKSITMSYLDKRLSAIEKILGVN